MEPFSPQIIYIAIASRGSGQDGSRGLGETNRVKRNGKVNESSLEHMGSPGLHTDQCGTGVQHRGSGSHCLGGVDGARVGQALCKPRMGLLVAMCAALLCLSAKFCYKTC